MDISFGLGLREVDRARLLRRADWRFLLAEPVPDRVWYQGDGVLLKAVQAVSGSLVVPGGDSAPAADCDLAVLTDPDRSQLRRAWAALRPGGACYVEWRSRGATPGALRRLVRGAGFESPCCYTPWPAPPHASLWLPWKSRAALRFFLARPVLARTPVQRALYALLRAAGTLALGLGSVRPVCAVAHKPLSDAEGIRAGERTAPGDPPTGRGELALLMELRAQWTGWGLGEPPARLSWLLRTGGWRSGAKIVGFVLAEPDPRPRLVAKMSRVPESVPALLREVEVLQHLEGVRPGGLPGIPRLLFTRRTAHSLIVGETAQEGVSIRSVLRRRNYRDLALRATDWLVQLALVSRTTPAPSSCLGVIDSTLDEFDRSFGAVLDAGMLRDSRDVVALLGGLPAVCEHRDFIPWNVLVGPGGALGVVDWEAAEPRGIPAVDMIYFLTYLGFTLDRALPPSERMIQSYRAGVHARTFTGAVHRECLSRYFSGTGLDPALVRPLRLFAWILHSRFEYRRLLADFGTPPPTPHVLRRSVYVRLWEEEIRQARDPW